MTAMPFLEVWEPCEQCNGTARLASADPRIPRACPACAISRHPGFLARLQPLPAVLARLPHSVTEAAAPPTPVPPV